MIRPSGLFISEQPAKKEDPMFIDYRLSSNLGDQERKASVLGIFRDAAVNETERLMGVHLHQHL